jgi:hypothetical protein
MTAIAAVTVIALMAMSPSQICAVPETTAGGPRMQNECYVYLYQTQILGQTRQTDVSLACVDGQLLAPSNVLRLRAKDGRSVKWRWPARDVLRIEYGANSRVRSNKSVARFGDRTVRVELVPVDDELPQGCDFERDAVEITVTK